MKLLLATLLTMTFLSCGKAENESGSYASFINQMSVDTDFDGIYDFHEKKMGTDPQVADLPFIEVKSQNIKLKGRNFTLEYEKEETSTFVLDNKIKRQVRLFLKERNYHLEEEVFSEKEKRRFCLSDDVYFEALAKKLYPEKLSFEYSVIPDQNKLSDSITNLKVNLLQDESTLQVNSQIFFANIDFNRAIERCLSFDLIDFNYTIAGRELEFSDVASDTGKNLSHIIIKNEDVLKDYRVNPKGNFLDQLRKQNIDFKISPSGEIIHIDQKRSSFALRESFSYYRSLKPDQKRWFFISSDSGVITDQLNPGQTYILALVSIKEILKSEKLYETQAIEQNSNIISLKGFSSGDEIYLNLDAQIDLISKQNINIRKAGYNHLVEQFGIATPRSVATGCSHVETNLNDGARRYELLKNLRLFAQFSSGESRELKNVNGKLVLKYTLKKEDFISGVASIQVGPINKSAFTYTRQTIIKDVGKLSKREFYRCARKDITHQVSNTTEIFSFDYKISGGAARRY